MIRYSYKFNRNKALVSNRIRIHLYVPALIAVALAVALCGSSCYTILKHPRVAELDYENPMDVGCMSCHDEPLYPITRPPASPPWWLDHEWGNELETVPIREGLRPAPGKIDNLPLKIPVGSPDVKVQPGGSVKEKKDEDKEKKGESKERKIRPKQKKKKKEDG